MKPWTTTSIASRYLVEFLEAAGQRVDDVLAGAGVARDALAGPELAMPLDAFRLLWQRAAALQPDIGIALVERFPAGQMHMLAHLALRSATVGAALDDVCRYATVTSAADQLTLERSGETARFSYHCRATDIENPWMAEHYLSMTTVFLMRATGREPPIRAVEFAARSQAPMDAYKKRFGVVPRFDTGCNAIEFDVQALDWPMLTHDTYLHAILERVAQAHQGSVRDSLPDSLLDSVRGEIVGSLVKGETPTVNAVAVACRLSPRALRDRLSQTQATFRQLLDEARRDLARDHLARGLSVTETAYLLGFSEPAALQHACKRWFKLSAGDLRQQVLGR